MSSTDDRVAFLGVLPARPRIAGISRRSALTAGGSPLARLSAIPIGGTVSATAPNGDSLIIVRPTANTLAAFSAVCTRLGCTVLPAGNELDCPCHGSVFDPSTGAVISGPAPLPLPKVQVTLSGDTVLSA